MVYFFEKSKSIKRNFKIEGVGGAGRSYAGRTLEPIMHHQMCDHMKPYGSISDHQDGLFGVCNAPPPQFGGRRTHKTVGIALPTYLRIAIPCLYRGNWHITFKQRYLIDFFSTAALRFRDLIFQHLLDN